MLNTQLSMNDKTAETNTPGKVKRIVLCLYVAGDAPNSRMAKANIGKLLERSAGNPQKAEVELEVVDVLANPDIMLEKGICLAPALQIVEPDDGVLVYGNLSDDKVLRFLPL